MANDLALEAASESHLFIDEGDEALVLTNELQLFKKVGDELVADPLGFTIGSIRAKGLNVAAIPGALSKKNAGKNAEKAEWCMLLGEAAIARDSPEEALTAITEASTIFRNAQEKKKEGDSLLMYAKACCKRKAHHEEGFKAGRDALALFTERGDEAGKIKAQLVIAALHVADGGLDRAREVAEEALVLSKTAVDKKLEIAALLMVADVFLLKEWSRQAAQKAQLALNLCRSIEFSRGESIALHTLVLALSAMGDTKEAQRIAEDGLERFGAKGDRKGQIAARSALVHVCIEKDDPEMALQHAEQELGLLCSPFDKKQAAYTKLTIALIHTRKREGSEATEAATEAMKMFKGIEDEMGQGVALYVLAFANIAYNDLDVAAASAKDAIDIFKKLGDKKWEAGAVLALCATVIANDSDPNGINQVFAQSSEATKIYKELGDEKGCAAAELMVAEALGNNDPDNALGASDKCLTEMKDLLGHNRAQAHILLFQARIHLSQDKLDDALQKAMAARRCCRHAEDRTAEALVVQTITSVNFRKYVKAADDGKNSKMMRDAIKKTSEAAKDALGLAKRCDNKHLMGMANVQVTRCLLANGKWDKAKESSQEALSNLRDVNDRQQEAVAMAVSAEVLTVLQDFDKARTVARNAMSVAVSVRDSGAENYARAVFNGAVEAEEAIRKPVAIAAVATPTADSQVEVIQAVASAIVEAPVASLDHAEVCQTILKVAQEIVAEAEDLSLDVGLMDAGIDSLSAVAFRNSLMKQIKGVNLPANIMFDYPTVNAIADMIVEETSR